MRFLVDSFNFKVVGNVDWKVEIVGYGYVFNKKFSVVVEVGGLIFEYFICGYGGK